MSDERSAFPGCFPVLLCGVFFSGVVGCTPQVPSNRPEAEVRDTSVDIAPGESAKVIKVLKGDELLLEKEGREARARILGIHCFEGVLDDPTVMRWGATSAAFLKDLVLGKEVVLDYGLARRDAHGRLLVYLEQEGKDVARSLLEAGVATVYTEFPFGREKAYFEAEAVAREAKKELWSDAHARPLLFGLRKQWASFRDYHSDGHIADPVLQDKELEAERNRQILEASSQPPGDRRGAAKPIEGQTR